MSKRILYVIPNYECNLKCSHCDIKDLKCEYNEEALIKAITENTYDEVILFGGEPTLYYDRLKTCIDTGKITSITTNLIGLTSDKYDLIIFKSDSNAPIVVFFKSEKFLTLLLSLLIRT